MYLCVYLYLDNPPPYFGCDREIISDSWAYLQTWRPWQTPYKAWSPSQVIHQFYFDRHSGLNWALVKIHPILRSELAPFFSGQKYDLIPSFVVKSGQFAPTWFLPLLPACLVDQWPPSPSFFFLHWPPISYQPSPPCFFCYRQPAEKGTPGYNCQTKQVNPQNHQSV